MPGSRQILSRNPGILKSFKNINPFMPTGAFNNCCPRDCVSRHNGVTSGAPLKPLRVDSALRALSTLRGLRGAPEVTPLCRETQSLGQQMLNAKVGINGLRRIHVARKMQGAMQNAIHQAHTRCKDDARSDARNDARKKINIIF